MSGMSIEQAQKTLERMQHGGYDESDANELLKRACETILNWHRLENPKGATHKDEPEVGN